MSVICTRCGSTDVSREAVINLKAKDGRHYDEETFLYGWCERCNNGRVLSDTDEIKAEIDRSFEWFIEKYGKEPEYAVCEITWKDNNKAETVNIQLSSDSRPDEDDDMFFYCDSLPGLKSLCEYGGEDFIVTGIHSFEKFCND